MRDDDSLHDEEKRSVTSIGDSGKGLLNWLKRPSRDASDEGSRQLDRRSYMRLAGGAAAAALVGGSASATAAAQEAGGETLDVTADPYNASGDGSGDDTGAIQGAIDDASAGDTVYLPAGTYTVSGSESVLEVHGDRHPDDLTIRGDGAETVIKYTGGNGGGNYYTLRVRGGLSEFECRDLVLDGGSESVDGSPTAGLTLNQLDEVDGQSYHFENCVVRGGYSQGANINGHGVSLVNCTVRENGGHGITFGPDTYVEDRQFLVDRCLVEDNALTHSGHYGIDHARGNFLVRDTVVRNNNGSASKIAGAGIETDGKWLRVRVDGNGGNPFQAAPGYEVQAMTFEDVVVSNNGGYWRLNDPVDYSFDGDIVVTNNGSDGTHATVHLFSAASLDGEGATLWSNNNDGVGFTSDSGAAGNVIGEYNHANNGGGPLGGTSNLDIGEQNEDEQTDLDSVPTAGGVGAWTGGDAGTDEESGSDDAGTDEESDSDDAGTDSDTDTASDGDTDAEDGAGTDGEDAGSEDDAGASENEDGGSDGDDDEVEGFSRSELTIDPDDFDV